MNPLKAWPERCRRAGPRDNPIGTARYLTSNLIDSWAQPDSGGPFDAVSGR
jgi:hypothetical protein